MNLKKSATAIILGTAMLFLSSGCSLTDFSTSSLLKPPKSIGSEAEIEKLIADTAGKDYTLKYPKSGTYRSAVIMTDLDGDSTDEAVAFYVNAEDTTHLHMLVMYTDGEEWKTSADMVSETNDIDRIDFSDINGDGANEIITAYSTFSANISKLACYSFSRGKTYELKSGQSCTGFCCGDFDNDGINEVMSLLLLTTENEASATMLDYNSESSALTEKANVRMDPNIVRYKSVSVSAFDDSTNGVIVDGVTSTEEMNTQVIYYNTELSLLRNPLFKEKTKNITARSISLASSDIDSDGKLEIPIVSKLPVPSDKAQEATADMVLWNTFSVKDELLATAFTTAADYNHGYFFKMPDIWLNNNVTAQLDAKENTMNFFALDGNKTGHQLCSLKVFSIDDWEGGKSIGTYELISRNERYAYTYINSESDTPLRISGDEIKKSLLITSEGES